MERMATGTRPSPRTIFTALLAGLAVLLLLFPASGIDTLPPKCYSMLVHAVPCEAWVAWAGGVVAAGLVALAMWMIDRLRQSGADSARAD